MSEPRLDLDAAAALPMPGSGATPLRHRLLAGYGRSDLSLAKIAEGHADALAIHAEAGSAPRAGCLYGVWASEGGGSRLQARPAGGGRWVLDGAKPYCSGASFVDAALVTAHCEDAVLLFDVDVDQRSVQAEPATWASPALLDTATGAVSFRRVMVHADRLLGGADWYLSRVGFWHGAIGPAACWAGGAQALIDAAGAASRDDPHGRAQVGALRAIGWGLSAILEQAGREIDADPHDRTAQSKIRALKVRHLIERMCTEVLDRFGRATGPRLLAFDAQAARQHMALALYIRQCHAERDLESIALEVGGSGRVIGPGANPDPAGG